MTNLSTKIPFGLNEFKALFIVVCIYRIIILITFGVTYTDSDQSIMWLGTVDYSHFDFQEPRFYGQDYNSFLEPLFALPLYKLGVPLHVALPCITSIFTITPFWIISNHFYKSGKKANALIILLLFVTMSLNYDLITTLPRGFVTGLFVSGFVFYFCFSSSNKRRYFFQIFLSIIAFSINPNSIILCAPIILYIWLSEGIRIKRFYTQSIIGVFIGGGLHLLVQSFYKTHPNYNIYTYDFGFSFEKWMEGIKHLDLFFNDLTPVFDNKGWFVFVLFALFVVYFSRKKKWDLLLVSIFSILIIIGPLALNKVHAGSESLFYPASRMFLAIPLIFSFLIGHVEIELSKPIKYCLYVICTIFCAYKLSNVDSKFKHLYLKNNTVSIEKTEVILEECGKINEVCQKYNVDLVVVVSHYRYDFYNYGCPACEENFPQTIRPVFERRTKIMEKIMPRIYKTVLLIDLDKTARYVENTIELKEIGSFLIKDNKLPTKKLFDKLQIQTRDY